MIEAVGVVVPAHNEETLLPACLTALRQAARRVSVPVHLLVAADSCTDRTVAVARACGAPIIGIRARNVGAARAAGMRELLRLTAGPDPAAIWLATTDADTVVPPNWLQRQVAHADRGWDVVLGTVTVPDWSEHPPHVPATFAARYESGDRPHPHVHGANIGIRASAYRAAGGFRPLRSAEDHALLAAAAEVGCSVLSADDVTVETSGRRHARAPHGFSHLLRTLAPAPQGQLWLSLRPAGTSGGMAETSDAVGDLRVETVVINVQDMRRAVDFWTATLGVRAAFGVLAGQQVLPGAAGEYVRELPGQVVGIT